MHRILILLLAVSFSAAPISMAHAKRLADSEAALALQIPVMDHHMPATDLDCDPAEDAWCCPVTAGHCAGFFAFSELCGVHPFGDESAGVLLISAAALATLSPEVEIPPPRI